MSERKFCESCGMPLDTEDIIGTDANGVKNMDYCIYCYKDGTFTEDVTMDEMIDISLSHMKTFYANDPSFSEDEARKQMQSFFPKLKRWQS